MRELVTRPKAILLYDATCRFCDVSSSQVLRLVSKKIIERLDINDPNLQTLYNISPISAQREMHLVTTDGKVVHGADAVRELFKLSKWLWLLSWLWYLPGFAALAQIIYLWVADHRYLFLGRSTSSQSDCENGACSVHLGRKT